MKIVGMFRELFPPGLIGLPSLRASIGLLDIESSAVIAKYLDATGVPVRVVMSDVGDPLNPEWSVPGGASLLANGLWLWRADLAHYVLRHRVGLPLEFVRDAQSGATAAVDLQAAETAYASFLSNARSLVGNP